MNLQQLPTGTQVQIELRPSDGILRLSPVLTIGFDALSVVFDGIPAGAAALRCVTTQPDLPQSFGTQITVGIAPGVNTFQVDCAVAVPAPPPPTPAPPTPAPPTPAPPSPTPPVEEPDGDPEPEPISPGSVAVELSPSEIILGSETEADSSNLTISISDPPVGGPLLLEVISEDPDIARIEGSNLLVFPAGRVSSQTLPVGATSTGSARFTVRLANNNRAVNYENLDPVESVLSVVRVDPPIETPTEMPMLGTGDVQATLRWNTIDDLDLFIVDPFEEEIGFPNPVSESGGSLDVDANAGCVGTITNPVENIFWPFGGAPTGIYKVRVNLFQRCTESSDPIPFTLTLLVNGQTTVISGNVDDEMRNFTSDDSASLEFTFLSSIPTPSPTLTPTPAPTSLPAPDLTNTATFGAAATILGGQRIDVTPALSPAGSVAIGTATINGTNIGGSTQFPFFLPPFPAVEAGTIATFSTEIPAGSIVTLVDQDGTTVIQTLSL
ncbi:MAG: hypothetical protein HC818_07470 [Synechococcaceae cyanobacterium RM1_1_27]|nr:hypothetical protein [Synechococcaceae cyanobacterium RM1_1_27]